MPFIQMQQRYTCTKGITTMSTRTIVLRSRARLSQDGRADSQDCHKCDRASDVRTSLVAVRFAAFFCGSRAMKYVFIAR